MIGDAYEKKGYAKLEKMLDSLAEEPLKRNKLNPEDLKYMSKKNIRSNSE